VNIKHAFSYIISIHVPIVGLAILPAFVTDFHVLLMHVHIVLLELMIDPISSITFEKFDEDLNIMQKPPRTLNENFFNKTQWLKSGTEGLIFFTILIFVLLISRTRHQNEGQQRAVVLITFVLGNLLLVINKLEKTKKRISENNSVKTVIVTSTIISGVLSAIIFIPFLRTLFRLELIDKYLWFVIFLFLFFLIIILNLIKQTKKFTTKMV
jgi:Ca2+-transporting ATPase